MIGGVLDLDRNKTFSAFENEINFSGFEFDLAVDVNGDCYSVFNCFGCACAKYSNQQEESKINVN